MMIAGVEISQETVTTILGATGLYFAIRRVVRERTESLETKIQNLMDDATETKRDIREIRSVLFFGFKRAKDDGEG